MSFSAAQELAAEQIPGQPVQLAFGGHLRSHSTPECELWDVPNVKAANRDSFVQSFLCLYFQCIFSIIFRVNSPCSCKDELNEKDEAFLYHHFALEYQSWKRP